MIVAYIDVYRCVAVLFSSILPYPPLGKIFRPNSCLCKIVVFLHICTTNAFVLTFKIMSTH